MHEASILVVPLTFSIIVPALNEADTLEATLQNLIQLGADELIVVDGGSEDATRPIALRYADRVIQSAPGRSTQMNAGARHATAEVFVFVHADTQLPKDAIGSIAKALSDGADAGTFRLEFDYPNPLLTFYSFWTRFRLPLFCFGDRGLFVTRASFVATGGYPSIPIFEDLEMVRMLRQRGTFAYLPQTAVTSARRFKAKGILRQQWLNSKLWTRYLLGANPNELAHHYKYSHTDKEVS